MLFAPGNHPRKVEKCLTLGADAVILDLEDAVAVAEKVGTRGPVVDALQKPRNCLGYVRVNPFETDYCYGDLQAVVVAGVDGIVLPKVESASQLEAVEWLIQALERERDLPVGRIDLLPIIETALGIENLPDIVQADCRVQRLSFGAGDYTLDTNMTWTRDELELLDARSAVVRASRAAGLEPPIDSVWIEIQDDEGFLASCERVRGLGYAGKLCIYPTQVTTANAVFTPSDEQVATARRVVAAFEQAEREGSASIQLDGYMVDYPIVEKARQTLALFERISQ